MKPRLILPVLPILMAIFMFAGSSNKAEAASVGFSIGTGGRYHHYHNGGYVRYRTVDPGYTTWYPSYTSSYSYPYYYSDYYYGSPYVYSSPSTNFNVWFGSGGRRYYGRHHRHGR